VLSSAVSAQNCTDSIPADVHSSEIHPLTKDSINPQKSILFIKPEQTPDNIRLSEYELKMIRKKTHENELQGILYGIVPKQ
jgi:hypothetical protein